MSNATTMLTHTPDLTLDSTSARPPTRLHVGDLLGDIVGDFVGDIVGDNVGDAVGPSVGYRVG